MLFTNQAPAFEKAPGAAVAIQTGSTSRTDLQAGSLPAEWIIEGNPTARGLPIAESKDTAFSCGLWECTAGQFKFIYYCDEIVHILEGEVTVREAGGAEHRLRAGDVAFFPQGLTTYWTVHGYVKKFAIFRSAPRGFLSRIVGKVNRVFRAILPGGQTPKS